MFILIYHSIEIAYFSFKITSRIDSRISSDQILSMKNCLATFARIWATLLASLCTNLHSHAPNHCRTCCVFDIICPKQDILISVLQIAVVVICASPSRIIFWIPKSLQKQAAKYAPISSAELESRAPTRVKLRVARTLPKWSRTTIPIPNLSLLTSRLVSQFTFLQLACCGAVQHIAFSLF